MRQYSDKEAKQELVAMGCIVIGVALVVAAQIVLWLDRIGLI